jgi:hypothetical protein
MFQTEFSGELQQSGRLRHLRVREQVLDPHFRSEESHEGGLVEERAQIRHYVFGAAQQVQGQLLSRLLQPVRRQGH